MQEVDPKLNEAIAFFEQMLQTLPGDRKTLEFLALAYEQTGQIEKRRDILIRLVDALLLEKDYENAKLIAGHLKSFKNHLPAMLAVERVDTMIRSDKEQQAAFPLQDKTSARTAEPPAKNPSVELPMEVHAISHSASAMEMDLVWLWNEREFLSKDLCMDILHALTERPMTDNPMLISALALLDEQHPEHTDRVMEEMQRASGIPAIPLELFEPTPAALKLLPSIVMQVKGVLPFAIMAKEEVLVALLNPLNAELKQEISLRINKPCHFFLVHPRSFQSTFSKLTLPQ